MKSLLDRIALKWARLQAYLYYKIILGETYQGRTWISTARRKDGADSHAQADDYNNLGYTLTLEDSRGIPGEYPVLDTCDFGSKHPIDEIQEHTYTLQVEDQTARLSGVVLSLQLTCNEGEIPLSSLKHKTNWAPIYVHLFSPCTVHKGEKIQVRTSAHLNTTTPRYEISVTTESGVNGQWAWSGCDS